MEENLFQTLLRGSRNVDRMRKEINETVTMMLGFLTYDGYLSSLYKTQNVFETKTFETKIFEEVDISWVLIFRRTSRCYHININLYFSSTSIYYSASDRTFKEIPLEDVISVYETLPGFVEKMIAEFPGLSIKVRPLIEASNRF